MASRSRLKALTRRGEFLALKEGGRVVHVTSWLLINWRPAEGHIRCGWTIPGHVGSAVVRNRLRRWGREFVRQWAAQTALCVDMNLVFKRKQDGFYRELKHREFDEALVKAVAKLR